MSSKEKKEKTTKKKEKKEKTEKTADKEKAEKEEPAPAPAATEAAPAEAEKPAAADEPSDVAPAPTPPPAEEKKEEVVVQREEKKEEKTHEPKRAQRATSNVFALFNQAQIHEFKEAFTMIDQNRDGLIDVKDLHSIYAQIGREPDIRIMEEMISESPGPLNFTMFLGLFGDRLKGTDPENTLREAFAMFDTDGKGKLPEEYVRDLLMNVGDTFTKEEIKLVWKEAPIEGGKLDYLKFVKLIKRGKEED